MLANKMEQINYGFHEEAIFSCACDEPTGLIERKVYPMLFTPENLNRFWELSSQFRVLFSDEIAGNFKKFLEVIMSQEGTNPPIANGLFWKIDDFVGVFYMTHIQSNDAQIHYSFFDRRHRGRIDITRRMIKHVFDKYGFHRLSAEIPYFNIKKKDNLDLSTKRYSSGPFEFIKKVGLREEGRKRESIMYDKEWFDVACLGILKEEADKWIF